MSHRNSDSIYLQGGKSVILIPSLEQNLDICTIGPIIMKRTSTLFCNWCYRKLTLCWIPLRIPVHHIMFCFFFQDSSSMTPFLLAIHTFFYLSLFVLKSFQKYINHVSVWHLNIWKQEITYGLPLQTVICKFYVKIFQNK